MTMRERIKRLEREVESLQNAVSYLMALTVMDTVIDELGKEEEEDA